jgi:hypothetical protein
MREAYENAEIIMKKMVDTIKCTMDKIDLKMEEATK